VGRSENDLPRAPRSDKVPYKDGEDWSDRHERRRAAAEDERSEMEVWADEHFVDLTVKNDGHHWIFKRDRSVVEWWPASGRIVLNRNYKKPRKAHDTEQAKALIGNWLNIPMIRQ